MGIFSHDLYFFSSPGTNIYDVNYAWDVISSGVVDYEHYGSVGNSYGRIIAGHEYVFTYFSF